MNHTSHSIFLASLLACASGLLGTGVADAAVVYSGVQDIPISTTFTGVYLDIATQGTVEPSNDPDEVTADSFTVGYSEPTGSWDVNFFFGGIGIAYTDTFQPFVDDTVAADSQILNVDVGTVIGGTAADDQTLSTSSFGGSGRPNGMPGLESHFDTPTVALYSAFTPGTEGYIAFVLNPGGSEQYGWMRVTLTDDGSIGTIHDWAYSDEVSFTVGQVPEPSSMVLLVLGIAGLCRRDRRS